MSKKDLTEQEIRSQYIRPAILAAGWKDNEIREEHITPPVACTSAAKKPSAAKENSSIIC